MILRGAVSGRRDAATHRPQPPEQRYKVRSVHAWPPSMSGQDEVSPIGFTPAGYSARTEKRALQWSVPRSFARRRKPESKGGEGRLDDLPVADRHSRTHGAQAQGRMADRSTRVTSGEKDFFPMGEHAHQRIFHLQGLSCSRKS